MLRSGPATPSTPARAAVPVAWLLVLLLPLHAFGVAFLPAWMPAHHHRTGAPSVTPQLEAVRAGATWNAASAAMPQRARAEAVSDFQAHASAGTQPSARRPDPAHSHAEHEHHGQHRHASVAARLHDAEDGAPQRQHTHGTRSHRHDEASIPHDHATSGDHRHDAAEALASQSVVDPAIRPATREATAPHAHATIGHHHHGADGAVTMVLAAQSVGDPVDAASARAGWDLPWPLLPALARVPACGAESTLRTHVPQPYPPPAQAGPLRPPRHHA